MYSNDIMLDTQAAMIREKTCNNCDSINKERDIRDIKKQKTKKNSKKMKEKNPSSVLFYVSIYLLFSL